MRTTNVYVNSEALGDIIYAVYYSGGEDSAPRVEILFRGTRNPVFIFQDAVKLWELIVTFLGEQGRV